ncbi:hypothetical protein LTS02_017904 [Friedmanniomyces endolithicus]|nr:hypothetical protein LTS02_017904 [Friedmanniomyces endolithicus]
MDTLEPVEPEPMISPCTALLDRRLQARIGKHEDAGTSAGLPMTTESLEQRITDPAIHGSQAVSSADSVPLGSTQQADGDVNQRLPLLRKQSSPSQSGITFTLSDSLYGSPLVREDGEECFERGRHAVLAASHLAPYGDDTSPRIDDVPLQSSEANIEEAVATSIEHQETSSPDEQGTGSGPDGTCRVSDERRPEDSVEEVDYVETNATKAGELKKTFKAWMKSKRMIEMNAMSRLSIRIKLPLDVKNTTKTTSKPTKVLKAMLKLTGMRYLVLQLKTVAVQ